MHAACAGLVRAVFCRCCCCCCCCGVGGGCLVLQNGDETISVSAKSLLCVTPHIRVSSGQFLSNLIPGWSGLRPLDVIGKGTIAITSYGGLFKLVLSKDER